MNYIKGEFFLYLIKNLVCFVDRKLCWRRERAWRTALFRHNFLPLISFNSLSHWHYSIFMRKCFMKQKTEYFFTDMTLLESTVCDRTETERHFSWVNKTRYHIHTTNSWKFLEMLPMSLFAGRIFRNTLGFS
jgi:hypothetical protein